MMRTDWNDDWWSVECRVLSTYFKCDGSSQRYLQGRSSGGCAVWGRQIRLDLQSSITWIWLTEIQLRDHCTVSVAASHGVKLKKTRNRPDRTKSH